MSSTEVSNERATTAPPAPAVDLKLEVVVLPVSDVDRAKRFYQGLRWRPDAEFTNGPDWTAVDMVHARCPQGLGGGLDGEFTNGPDWRAVQIAPPGSPCSIHFGKGITTAAPGSVK